MTMFLFFRFKRIFIWMQVCCEVNVNVCKMRPSLTPIPVSYCKFWIYWVGVNTKFTIWQLKIYNMTPDCFLYIMNPVHVNSIKTFSFQLITNIYIWRERERERERESAKMETMCLLCSSRNTNNANGNFRRDMIMMYIISCPSWRAIYVKLP